MEILKANWTTDGDSIKIAVPFSKVDIEKRTVSGFATLDNIDSHGDVVTSEASVEAFKRFRGNLREMHQPLAVGKVVSFEPKDYYDPADGKVYSGVYVTSYVSKGAQDTWEKVLDGTLSGFSIGGAIKTVENQFVADKDAMVRFIKDYDLVELSLVDNPANQLANIFSIEKVNGEMVMKGMATEVKAENIFWCGDDFVAITSSHDNADCESCGTEMERVGWVEKDAEGDSVEVRDVSEEYFAKSAYKSGDFVSWTISNGTARGKILKHIKSNIIVELYRPSGNGWSTTEKSMSVDSSLLKKISPLKINTEKNSEIDKVTEERRESINGGVLNKEIAKEGGTDVEDTTNVATEEVAVEATTEVASEAAAVEEAVVEEVAAETAPEGDDTAVEKAADIQEVAVEELDFAKKLDELKDFFAAGFAKNASESATGLDSVKAEIAEIAKSSDAKYDELSKKYDEVSATLATLKGGLDVTEKRIDAVESDTAIKKSVDLGGTTEEPIKKSKWGGTFLGVQNIL